MANVKTITVGETPVKFRASASVLRLYRDKFGRDMLTEFDEMQEAMNGADEKTMLQSLNLETLENIAYILALAADPDDVPDRVTDWLDRFEFADLFGALADILALWMDSMRTMSKPKKKAAQPPEK